MSGHREIEKRKEHTNEESRKNTDRKEWNCLSPSFLVPNNSFVPNG